MSRPITSADLPEDLARFAEAQIADGRFASVDAVVEAGLEALKEREAIQREWLEDARAAVDRGRAAHARGEAAATTADELMDGIARELGLAE